MRWHALDSRPVRQLVPGAPGRDHEQLARPTFGVGLAWLAFLGYPAAIFGRHPSVAQGLAATAVAVAAAAYIRALRRATYGVAAGPPWGTVALLSVIGVILPLAAGPGWLGIPLYAAVLLGFTLRPGRASAGAAAAGLVCCAAGLAAGTATPQVVSVALLTVLAGMVAVGARGLARIGRELLAAQQDAKRLAVVQERMRLARELHDSVKQHVFVAAMEVGAAQALIGAEPAPAADRLNGAAEAITQAQRELASLIDGSRPPVVDGRRLAATLQDWAREWSRRHGIAVTVEVTGRWPVRADLGEPLLRGAQEALRNVARHSRARSAHVALERLPRGAVLTVSDDGAGFAPGSAPYGQGLRGIRERLGIAGGMLTVTSAPGAGTTVRLDCAQRHMARS